ncbi:MAG: glycosyltransferase [Thermoplasmata archaeon]
MEVMKILQLAHGRIIPQYFSGYSKRCHDIFKGEERHLISIGGPFFFDRKENYAEQYRSLLLTIFSFLKGNRSFEIFIARGKYIREKFYRRVNSLINESDIIVFEGPWLYNIFRNKIKGKFIVYDAHNVEYLLRKNNPFQEEVRKLEGDLVKNADLIFAVTKEDMDAFKDIYSLNDDKIYYVPIQIELKEYLWNGKNSKDIIFIGSLYEPNILALKEIERIAENLHEFNFHIIGSLNRYPKRKKIPNVIYHGTISENEKDRILNNSFLALNPVLIGAGRNVKMLDYISHGLPVLTTSIGLRGFERKDLENLIFVDEIENFVKRIKEIDMEREKLVNISKKLYEYFVEMHKKETEIKPIEIIKKRIKI